MFELSSSWEIIYNSELIREPYRFTALVGMSRFSGTSIGWNAGSTGGGQKDP